MSIESVKEYLKKFGKDEEVMIFDESSATVELAAKAVGTEEVRIAKSLTFMVDGSPIMIVASGDTKIDNKKYKSTFSCKAKMLSLDEAENLVGHKVGGVCPFDIKPEVKVYLDDSLKRFEYSYPAAGGPNTAVKMTIDDFERCTQNFEGWVDVCKIKEI